MTTFAIDYDGTWTADPEAFRAFAALLRRRGHRVLIVTARIAGHAEVTRECQAHADRVIFSGADYKREVCDREGESVDIWVDDMPGMIGPDLDLAKVADVFARREELKARAVAVGMTRTDEDFDRMWDDHAAKVMDPFALMSALLDIYIQTTGKAPEWL